MGLIPEKKAITSAILNRKINIFELLLGNNIVNTENKVTDHTIDHGSYDLLVILFDHKNIINKNEIWKSINEGVKITWELRNKWIWNRDEMIEVLNKYNCYSEISL
jgi:hypothetical protein